MATLSDSEFEIINSNLPIGKGLTGFLDAFQSTCADLGVPATAENVHQITDKGAKDLVFKLISLLSLMTTTHQLLSRSGRGTLWGDLWAFYSRLDSNQQDISSSASLLQKVVNNAPDVEIWDTIYSLVTPTTTPTTPPPPPLPLPNLDQIPISFNTGSIVDSSEHRTEVDQELDNELGSSLHTDLQDFHSTFFGPVSGLEAAAASVFAKCQQGNNPIYEKELGWRDWPVGAKESDVLPWFASKIENFLDFAKDIPSVPMFQRRLLSKPNHPLAGSTAKRKLDIGFMRDSKSHHWSEILVPGELKCNPIMDKSSATWLDLARYVREVLFAQDTRRFVLGFTLCGSMMRLWEFDRLGGVASLPFDINKDGLQFVSVVLGYLWMDEEQLGFDPTIFKANGKRYIDIIREGQKERLVLDELIKRASCVAGRATTCWKAYREDDESKRPLVIKDSWQYPERDVEGEWLKEATEKKVVNVARYYHHATVCIGGRDDDICNNVRKGLDIITATNFKPQSLITPPSASQSESLASAGRKRSSNCTKPAPPSKRICSSSQTKDRGNPALWNRVHRRVVVCDYGKPIYRASSRVALLAALEGNITGYKSLHDQAGILQSDVSIGNLMMNEDGGTSQESFMIDLDLAIKVRREESSGARSKIGTRAFMAVRALFGDKHSYMHDLESFFWVLFWICIHYNGSNEKSRVTNFDLWNFAPIDRLGREKLGLVADERHFNQTIMENFTPYYQPLIQCVDRLRKALFPNGKTWVTEEPKLYIELVKILREAKEDPDVA